MEQENNIEPEEVIAGGVLRNEGSEPREVNKLRQYIAIGIAVLFGSFFVVLALSISDDSGEQVACAPLPDGGTGEETFERLDYNYSKNKDCVWQWEHVVWGADPATFAVVGDWYARDAFSVFYMNNRIENSDPSFVELLGDRYAKDGKNVYFQGEIIFGADPETYEFIDNFYAKDKHHVYHRATKLRDSDSNSFVILSDIDYCRFAKDDTNVYRGANLIYGADVSTFSLTSSCHYSLDSTTVYHDQAATDIDRATFEVVTDEFSRDSEGFYYGRAPLLATHEPISINETSFVDQLKEDYSSDEIVHLASLDIESFQIVGHRGSPQKYIKDKNGVYKSYGGTRYVIALNILDPATFELLDGGYTKDSEAVYHADRVVTDADPSTFVVLTDTNYGKDANQLYRMGYKISHAIPEELQLSELDVVADVLFDDTSAYWYSMVGTRETPYTSMSYVPINGIDVHTVAKLGECHYEFRKSLRKYYHADKDRVFVIGTDGSFEILSDVDVDTFEYVRKAHGEYYAKDQNNVYVGCGEILVDTDPNTFVFPQERG